MRDITFEMIAGATERIFKEACMCPPDDVLKAIRDAYNAESDGAGKEILRQLTENGEIAKNEQIPYCQDTGMAVVFAKIGRDAHICCDIYEAVDAGVRAAYEKNYFRKSVLTPLSRKNTGDNTPSIVHIELTDGDSVRLTAAPKGFGSENMSRIAMLKPSDGKKGIVDFVVEAAKAAGGNPCPPVILGVGIGGDFEKCAIMAKEQLLRKVGEMSPDPELAEMEAEIKDGINALKMGPMGIGGDCYCMDVHIAAYPTHLAGLPVAVNFCCHALRHAEEVI